MKFALLLITIATIFIGCSKAETNETPNGKVTVELADVKTIEPNPLTQKSATKNSGALKNILFFMNPNGYPCQKQDEILRELHSSLDGLAQVTYIKTTVPQDRQQFYNYGVRSLPSLIVLNADGSEHKRLPPGIQQGQSILMTLN